MLKITALQEVVFNCRLVKSTAAYWDCCNEHWDVPLLTFSSRGLKSRTDTWSLKGLCEGSSPLFKHSSPGGVGEVGWAVRGMGGGGSGIRV